MATAIERLYKLSVDGNQAIAQLNKLSDSTKSVDKQLKEFTKGFQDFRNKVLAGFTVATVVASFKNIVAAMSEINDSAQKLGVTTDELQKLRFAAKISGVEAGALDTALKKLSVGLTQIDDASSEAGKQLKALGVTSKDSVFVALSKVADKFKEAGDGAGKTSVAVAGLGKSGNQLIPMLNEGAAGLKKLADEAEALGLIVDGKTIALFDQFGDTMDKLEKTSQAVGVQIAAGLLPALTALADAFLESKKNGEGFQDLGASLGEGLINISEFFIKAWTTVKQFASGLGAAAAALVQFLSGNFSEASTIIKEWAADTEKAGVRANKIIADLRASYEDYLKNGVKPAAKGTKELDAAAAAHAKTLAELNLQYIGLTRFLSETAKLNLQIKLGLVSYTEAQLKLAVAIAKRKDEIELNKNLQKSYADLFKEQDKQAESLDKLIAAIDPTVKKTEEWAEGLTILTQAYQAGAISAEELDLRTKQLNDTYSGELERLKALAAAYSDIFAAQQDQIDAYTDLIQSLDPAIKKNEEYAKGLEIITNAYALGRITAEEMDKAVEKLNKKFLETNPVIDIVQSNFKAFFDNLAQGTANASELFKRMVQSIIAQLLRLAAQKAILAAFGIDIGIGGKFAKGAAFQGGQQIRNFAKGAVLNSPVLFPMSGGLGQAGEAGAEGVFPLARTSSGDLGVKGVSPTVNVNVINNTNSEIEIRQSEDGTRVDIVVDRARRAVAADIRSGGNLVSSAIESTYALGRARGG